MPFDPGAGLQLGIAVALLGGGVAAGLILGRAGSRARAQIRELELQLRETQEEHAAYRDQVAKHFAGTSDLFRDLTHQYTTLYAHLAEGARDLCPDRVPELGRGLGEPSLVPSAAGTAAPSAPPESEASEEELTDAEASIEALTREVAREE